MSSEAPSVCAISSYLGVPGALRPDLQPIRYIFCADTQLPGPWTKFAVDFDIRTWPVPVYILPDDPSTPQEDREFIFWDIFDDGPSILKFARQQLSHKFTEIQAIKYASYIEQQLRQYRPIIIAFNMIMQWLKLDHHDTNPLQHHSKLKATTITQLLATIEIEITHKNKTLIDRFKWDLRNNAAELEQHCRSAIIDANLPIETWLPLYKRAAFVTVTAARGDWVMLALDEAPPPDRDRIALVISRAPLIQLPPPPAGRSKETQLKGSVAVAGSRLKEVLGLTTTAVTLEMESNLVRSDLNGRVFKRSAVMARDEVAAKPAAGASKSTTGAAPAAAAARAGGEAEVKKETPLEAQQQQQQQLLETVRTANETAANNSANGSSQQQVETVRTANETTANSINETATVSSAAAANVVGSAVPEETATTSAANETAANTASVSVAAQPIQAQSGSFETNLQLSTSAGVETSSAETEEWKYLTEAEKREMARERAKQSRERAKLRVSTYEADMAIENLSQAVIFLEQGGPFKRRRLMPAVSNPSLRTLETFQWKPARDSIGLSSNMVPLRSYNERNDWSLMIGDKTAMSSYVKRSMGPRTQVVRGGRVVREDEDIYLGGGYDEDLSAVDEGYQQHRRSSRRSRAGANKLIIQQELMDQQADEEEEGGRGRRGRRGGNKNVAAILGSSDEEVMGDDSGSDGEASISDLAEEDLSDDDDMIYD